MSGIGFTRAEPDDDEAVMQFYDSEGNRVSAGSPKADVQHLSNDPNRPDAKATAPGADKAVKAPAETKAKTGPDESK